MVKLRGMLFCIILYCAGYFMLGVYVTAGIFAFHIVGVPLIFKYSKKFRRNLIFANAFQWPLRTDFDEPASSGILGARNLYLRYYSKVDKCYVRIGVWQILPKSTQERLEGTLASLDAEQKNKLMNEELANAKTPVIMYCHGNSNTRAASHRILLYKFFQQMDFHTIAFDYRGYADSTNINPSEAGVVEDTLIVYDWLVSLLKEGESRAPLFLWGHSLGTGISSHLLGNLQELAGEYIAKKDPLPLPNGLILEAPFNNLAYEVSRHPLTPAVRWLPYFEDAFVEPFKSCPEHEFKSDLHLSKVKGLPVLILHAKDDGVVPYNVGLKLYKSIVESRADGGATVAFQSFEKTEGLGHKYICMAEDLPDIIEKFVKAHQ